jgi:hypothetical protein
MMKHELNQYGLEEDRPTNPVESGHSAGLYSVVLIAAVIALAIGLPVIAGVLGVAALAVVIWQVLRSGQAALHDDDPREDHS